MANEAMETILNKTNEGRKSIREASNQIYDWSRVFTPKNFYEQKEMEKLLVERNRLEKALMAIVNSERRIRKLGL